MKKIIIFSILIVVMIIFGVYSYLPQEGCTKEAKICPDGSSVSRNSELSCEFDPCPDFEIVDLGIGGIADELEGCQGYDDAVTVEESNSFQFCAYDISNEDLAKLRLIENLEGVNLCTERYFQDCPALGSEDEISEEIWGLEYSYIGVRRGNAIVSILKKGDMYYYTRASGIGGPPGGSTYRITNFDESLIEMLKD
jgi:hypothetical protein